MLHRIGINPSGIRVQGAARLQQYQDDTRGVIITVDGRVLASLLMEIFLLRESLADQVVCISEGTTVSLQVNRESAFSTGIYGKSTADMALSLRDLEFISSFLLKY